MKMAFVFVTQCGISMRTAVVEGHCLQAKSCPCDLWSTVLTDECSAGLSLVVRPVLPY